jgi:hypothetical protein
VIKWQHLYDEKQFVDLRLLALRLRATLKSVKQLHRRDHRYCAIAGRERFHPLAHARIPAHERDTGICIEEILHALQIHGRGHRPLRRACECRVIDRDAIKETMRPGGWRHLAAWSQFYVIADHCRFELRTLFKMQPDAKGLRQNKLSAFY